jgi:hypothetical protein
MYDAELARLIAHHRRRDGRDRVRAAVVALKSNSAGRFCQGDAPRLCVGLDPPAVAGPRATPLPNAIHWQPTYVDAHSLGSYKSAIGVVEPAHISD